MCIRDRDKTPLVDESFDDEYEDMITIPVPLEAFGDAGLLGKNLHIQVIDGAVVITEDIKSWGCLAPSIASVTVPSRITSVRCWYSAPIR